MSVTDSLERSPNPDTLFALLCLRGGQFAEIDRIDMPIELMKANIDPNTFRFTVPHGGDFSVEPMVPPVLTTLMELYRTFRSLDGPCRFQYVLQQRQDGIIQKVEVLFGSGKYTRVRSQQELEALIRYHAGKNPAFKPEIIVHRNLGELVQFMDKLGPEIDARLAREQREDKQTKP